MFFHYESGRRVTTGPHGALLKVAGYQIRFDLNMLPALDNQFPVWRGGAGGRTAVRDGWRGGLLRCSG